MPESKDRLLIVDDEGSLLAVMQKYLTRLGYQVTTAMSGEEAWPLFQANPSDFALVLVDIVLPGISGDELLRRILELKPGIRILISSGYPFDLASLPVPNTRQVRFLQKPFAPQMLAEAIHGLLAESADALSGQ